MAPVKEIASFDEISRDVEEHAGRSALLGRYHVGRSLDEDYELTGKVLGEGLQGGVRLATRRDLPGHRVAVKCLSVVGVRSKQRHSILTEVAIHLCMDHPHVARLVEVYEPAGRLELAVECLEGGELFDRVKLRRRFPEAAAANITWQLLSAISYMHGRGIVHRDLKLENIMFASYGSDHLKLIDFGFSKFRRSHGKKLKTECGTLSYIAPEVYGGAYTSKCDVWSLGVVVFVLLSGQMPFYGPDVDQIRNIKSGGYSMKPALWSKISHEAIDFVQSLLNVDPKGRLAAEDAIQHPWLATHNPKPLVEVCPSVVRALCNHVMAPKFRRCCRRLMARMLPNVQLGKVCELFVALDTSHTGAVALGDWLQRPAVEMEVRKNIPSLDGLEGCRIEYSDFLAAMMESEISVSDELLSAAFTQFDSEKSGCITRDDLHRVVGEAYEGASVGDLMHEADSNGDGSISLHEFQECVRGRPLLPPLPRAEAGAEGAVLGPSPHLSTRQQAPTLPVWQIHGASSPTPGTPASLPKTPAGTPGATPMRRGGHLRSTVRGFDGGPDRRGYPVLLPRLLSNEALSPFCGSDAKTPFSVSDSTPTCMSDAKTPHSSSEAAASCFSSDAHDEKADDSTSYQNSFVSSEGFKEKHNCLVM